MSAKNWHELAPAYALGALEPEEAAEFERELLRDASLRTELEQYQAIVGELPLALDPVTPPPSVKEALLAKAQPSVQPTAAPAKQRFTWLWRGWSIFSQAALAAAVLAIALLSAQLFNTNAQLQQAQRESTRLSEQAAAAQELVEQLRSQQQALNAELAAARQNEQRLSADLDTRSQQLRQVEAQIQTNEEALTFLAANDLASRPLSSAASSAQAEGTMFMRPGNTEAVVLVRGLPALDRSRTYQFWLAEGDRQVNAGVLTLDADGTGRLVFNAPVPVDRFAQVMVTEEMGSLAPVPSEKVVLQGELT